jgi:hypothetical protein
MFPPFIDMLASGNSYSMGTLLSRPFPQLVVFLKQLLRYPADVKEPASYDKAEIEAKHPLLRRWDHDGSLDDAFGGALQIVELDDRNVDDWHPLEDGVEIWFEGGGSYQVGDYWLIPARTATGDVEWPDESDDDGKPCPVANEPDGPEHYYAPLLIATKEDAGWGLDDCRCKIVQADCERSSND